jgi:hypothetical protein
MSCSSIRGVAVRVMKTLWKILIKILQILCFTVFLYRVHPEDRTRMLPERSFLSWIFRLMLLWIASLMFIEMDLWIIHGLLEKGGLSPELIKPALIAVFKVYKPFLECILAMLLAALGGRKILEKHMRGITAQRDIPIFLYILSLCIILPIIGLTFKLNLPVHGMEYNIESYTRALDPFGGPFGEFVVKAFSTISKRI